MAPRSRARTRGKRALEPDKPADVFQDLLDEATSKAVSRQDDEGKVVKKRRVGGKIVVSEPTWSQNEEAPREPSLSPSPEPPLQTIDYNPEDFSEEEDDEDEFFEDVDLGDEDGSDTASPAGQKFDLVLNTDEKSGKSNKDKRRAPAVIRDNKLVVTAHQLHIACLLSHLSLRNHWCNDERVHRVVRKIFPRDLRDRLEDDESNTQYIRDQLLREALQHAVRVFSERFRKTARGMSRAWWDSPEGKADPPSYDDLDLITSVEDFRRAASSLRGSGDLGAQLFCATLRANGLEARLVHSLQVLPLSGSIRPKQTAAPSIPMVRFQDTRSGMGGNGSPRPQPVYDHYSIAPEDDISTEVGKAAGVRRRLAALGGRSSLTQKPATTSSTQLSVRPAPAAPSRSASSNAATTPLRESPHPVYWVEVLSPAYATWIAVDPIVTKTVAKPLALHPALDDKQNMLAYVIGMEEDGAARDVTMRYTKFFNAKTRKLRIDGVAGSTGDKWWKKVMRMYKRSHVLSGDTEAQDSVEDAEFQRRLMREGMPARVEDFKGHPVYALERHLRRNEVIHPKNQVGLAGVGRGLNKTSEPVYRRAEVHPVKSASAWYRRGRQIKRGQQPMKRAPVKRRHSIDPDQDGEDDTEGQGLYAFFQTELYMAPPVILGRVPRNAFGNLDVYVPSMIPTGAIHILHADTRHAAKLLGVDFADAVTGFEFKGRQGNAVVKGAVVAAEYRDAIIATLEGFETEREEAAAAVMTRVILRLWKRFLAGLKVKERVQAYARSDEDDNAEDASQDSGSEFEVADEEGGFVSEAAPKMRRRNKTFLPGPRGDFTVIEGPRIEFPEPEPNGPAETGSSPVAGEAMSGGFIREGDDDGSLFGGSDHDVQEMAQDDMGNWYTADGEQVSTHAADPAKTGKGDSHATEHNANMSEAPTDKNGQEEVAASDSNGSPSTTTEAKAPDHIEVPVPVKEVPKATDPENSDGDNGSLLSEDPEDLDAVPDWLA